MPSEAVSELDDLLGELKENKVFMRNRQKPEAASHATVEKVDVAPPQPPKRAVAAPVSAPSAPPSSGASGASLDDIDSIISGMNFDKDAPDNVAWCAFCKKGIPKGTPHLQVPGSPNKYHNDHWLCGVCAKPLSQEGYYEKGGVIHCEGCYKRKVLPHCYGCAQPITTAELLIANGNKFHRNCFTCTFCRKQLGTEAYFYKDGGNYCEQHYHDKYDPRCSVCALVIEGNILVARNREYHPQCFKCGRCQKQITSEKYLEGRGGIVICRNCDPALQTTQDKVPTTVRPAGSY